MPLAAAISLAMLVVAGCRSRCSSCCSNGSAQIQIGASLLVIGFGVIPAHRPAPSRAFWRGSGRRSSGLWSFAVAIAHGAGLMLVPIYLGLCRAADARWRTSRRCKPWSSTGLATGGVGLRCPYAGDDRARRSAGLAGLSLSRPEVRSRSWFNLDAAWAASLILVGIVGLGAAIMPGP